MLVFVLNCGSSSVKFQLVSTSLEQIENDTETRLAEGVIANIGLAHATVDYRSHKAPEKLRTTEEILDHQHALERTLALLTTGEGAAIASADAIEAVGHRFVHGGEEFTNSTLIDDDVLAAIERCTPLAPLHNPANLRGYRLARVMLGAVPHAAVFDTAFHQSMPRHAFLYALPWSLYERLHVRRYGFHGTSHRYVHSRLARVLGKTRETTSSITIHLGNGCSMAAIRDGRSIDTSTGFTPLEGLVMGTRSGDVDAAIPLYVMEREGVGLHEATSMLNKFSGLAGLSGVSGDMRAVERAADEGNDRARAALEVFCYRIKKYTGAYFAALEGHVDAVAFAGGIGENSVRVRAAALDGLTALGLDLDAQANAALASSAPPTPLTPRGERRISTAESRIPIFVVPTDEELVIARDTVRCLAAAHPHDARPRRATSVR